MQEASKVHLGHQRSNFLSCVVASIGMNLKSKNHVFYGGSRFSFWSRLPKFLNLSSIWTYNLETAWWANPTRSQTNKDTRKYSRTPVWFCIARQQKSLVAALWNNSLAYTTDLWPPPLVRSENGQYTYPPVQRGELIKLIAWWGQESRKLSYRFLELHEVQGVLAEPRAPPVNGKSHGVVVATSPDLIVVFKPGLLFRANRKLYLSRYVSGRDILIHSMAAMNRKRESFAWLLNVPLAVYSNVIRAVWGCTFIVTITVAFIIDCTAAFIICIQISYSLLQLSFHLPKQLCW